MNANLLEHVVCNLCGADDFVVVYPSRRQDCNTIDPAGFRSSGDEHLLDPLVKCNKCGLMYVTPRVNQSLVMEGYTGTPDPTFVSQASAREITFRKCMKTIQKAWAKPPGRILDVGTAGGTFLKAAQDAGWEVVGCEPNRWLCQWAEENYGIAVQPGTLAECSFAPESFDVVTLWDVLEHTPDPMHTLDECVRLLKPGGLLVVNYPDSGSWIAKLMGQRWVFLVSVHYYYFTRKTLCAALSRHDLDVVTTKPHYQTLTADYILRRATPILRGFATAARALCSTVGLGQSPVPYWIGQTVTIARKR